MALVIILDISLAIIICEQPSSVASQAVPDNYNYNYFFLVLTKPLA